MKNKSTCSNQPAGEVHKCNHILERNLEKKWLDLINNGMNNETLKNYIPNFIEGCIVGLDGLTIVGEKGKEVIIHSNKQT